MSARKHATVGAAFLVAVLLAPAKTVAWGPEGHIIVARIAELNLSPAAKAALAELLPDTPFSGSNSISDPHLPNYADFVKHNSQFPQFKDSGPWHFVDIPVDPPTDYDPDKFCKNGQCVLEKIEQFKGILADKSQPKVKRQEALVFLVHLVGDLHQPLHCATRNDTGGNDLKVKYLGNPGSHHPMNLHSVWDSNLVRENMTTFDPKGSADKLNEVIQNADRNKWRQGAVKDWMMESYDLARTTSYKFADGTPLPTTGHPNLDKAYVDKNKLVVAEQLKKGGIRLAKVLNDALAPPSP
jgi:hypothetical protein